MIRKVLLLGAHLAVVLIIIGIVWSFFGIVELWDGGFPQVEFQISFLDEQRSPLKGVKLAVTDSKEELAFGYPVIDYRQDSVPTSNDDGLMIFHHINLTPEFGGKCRWLFFVFPVGECEAPKYTLHFLIQDKEMARYEYHKYLGEGAVSWGSLPKVKRQFSEIGNSPQSLPERLRPENRNVPPILEYRVIAKTIIVNQGRKEGQREFLPEKPAVPSIRRCGAEMRPDVRAGLDRRRTRAARMPIQGCCRVAPDDPASGPLPELSGRRWPIRPTAARAARHR